MNPLLALMHDTARPLLKIDCLVQLMQARFKELGITDEKMLHQLELIKKYNNDTGSLLDKYYLEIKVK